MGIAAMITSIKFNDRRNKREVFSRVNGNTNTENLGIKLVPVSEETLQEIRNKLKKQRLAVFKKQLLVSGILIIVITTIIIYIA
ncbi:hypothetical protein D1816_13160 [Aquimarina sp. AD10]|uniref:hypothetical protein n=1 Tax=Aquimarina sp. AD10 TaxID=1714849 RepID=UPI000E4A49B3|nr:hypothetical protein [Aquimarina sp. AD10]AXT61254.1 hypothetical protein D1816_13160 [Aquimarina sp. AD10]RKN02129.1 hypothetical protein D7033_01445 [Aquimarina sp. AD10]